MINFLKKNKSLKEKNLKEQIDLIKKKLLKNKIKPAYQKNFDLLCKYKKFK